jgi:large subunit ribosomal protein L13e
MQDANVKRLSDYKAKLILFPKHEGKLKKGEIPDATKEKVKAASQVKASGVFALPAVDKSQGEKTAITKEMTAQKTYLKLRQARIDKRYEGKRIAAAKKAEEAKK